MRHFFTTRVRVILVVAVLLAAGLSIASSVMDFTLPEKVVQTVLAPLRTGVSHLKSQAEQFYSYMFRYEALQAENISLKEQISQMQDAARDAEELRRENDRLRDLLELKARHEDFKLVDSYIISWDSNDWSSTFTIDRGEKTGIQEGMCVITANGEVVGLVTQVGPNYSVVKTVLDSSLEISANIASSGYSGIVQGGFVTGQEGMLRMDYLPTNAIIRNNEQVVTTGSTVYPRDLILGYVVDAGFDEIGVAKYAVLEPAADFDSLEQVFVLVEYENG